MTLREQVHQIIDTMDDQALKALGEHIQFLLHFEQGVPALDNIPTHEEVRKLTSVDKGNWAAELSAEREVRV